MQSGIVLVCKANPYRPEPKLSSARPPSRRLDAQLRRQVRPVERAPEGDPAFSGEAEDAGGLEAVEGVPVRGEVHAASNNPAHKFHRIL